MFQVKATNSRIRAVMIRKVQSFAAARLHTLAPLYDAAKHPIQRYGFDYVEKQKESGRPLSPHLQIYKPQWTWYVSGGHRMTGMAMGTVVTIFSIGMLTLPFDFTQVINFFHGLGLPTPLSFTLKFIIAFPIVFHALNGVRFLGFDLGYGLPLATIYKTAYGVVGISVILALILAGWRRSDKTEHPSKQ